MERTLKRNSGKQYVTAKGKVIKSRELKEIVDSNVEIGLHKNWEKQLLKNIGDSKVIPRESVTSINSWHRLQLRLVELGRTTLINQDVLLTITPSRLTDNDAKSVRAVFKEWNRKIY